MIPGFVFVRTLEVFEGLLHMEGSKGLARPNLTLKFKSQN